MKCEKVFEKAGIIKIGFLIFTIVLMFLKSNPFLNSVVIVDILTIFSAFAGLLVALYVIVENRKKIFKSPLFYLLMAFELSYGLSILFNFKFSFIANIKDILWFFVQIICMFFAVSFEEEVQKKKHIKLLSWLYLTITFIMAVGSLVFVFINAGGAEILADGSVAKWGFMAQRLIGLYRSPNYGAIYCTISIVIALGCYKGAGKKEKVFLIINAVVNLLYILYSGSKTGMIVLAVAIALYVVKQLFFIVIELKNKKSCLKPLTYMVAVIAVCAVTFIFVKPLTASLISLYTAPVSQTQSDSLGESTGSNISSNTNDGTSSSESVTFDRQDYVPGQELGNGRLLHWKVALKVFKEKAVFGTTTRGYTQALLELYPNSTKFEKADSLENDGMTLLVCTGIIGTLLFLTFALVVLIKIIKILSRLIRQKAYGELQKVWTALTVVLVIAASAMFTDAIIFTNVLQSAVFWIALGYIISFDNKRGELQRERADTKELISE